ncbi:NUDIX hydrolase [Mesorhizobium sp. LjNodule214]|uniref:NUDIX hydrolase n=1 Tax=Mesorhizobium sp. LjNodule214 TaxID=3342252 RepID=UPI003ECD0527
MQDRKTLAKKETAKSDRGQAVSADLIAVVIAVTNGEPRVLTIGQAAGALPSGPFELGHRSLQSGLRAWVERQTGHPLGYIEQLYTFADRDRIGDEHVQRVISISYLGLTREEQTERSPANGWHGWYDYFPWEDHRAGVPTLVSGILMPQLRAWADEAEDPDTRHDRWQRATIAFGFDECHWNEELVLQRYELLYEAALVAESRRSSNTGSAPSVPGRPMIADHRRILATGIARLRTKIKYRPVVFELMPATFTLLQLQRTVEALAGRLVHKPNFRRIIEEQDLVEETGETMSATGGRPAKRFRFRQTVLAERTVAGTKLPLSRV